MSSLEDGEQLFTGLKQIDWQNYESCEHNDITQEEVEAALATAPNGALFGSSYYRTPFPYGLWIWNWCEGSSGVFKKWLNNSFGMAPVLMSNVNPALRSSVAKNVLDNNGYFQGDITYDIIEGKPEKTKTDTVMRPRTAKIQYHVNFGPLFRLDSIEYLGFTDDIMKKITTSKPILKTGDPFSIANLDRERQRIYNTLRNNGYYYYKPSYTTYMADTLQSPGKVQLQLHLADSLGEEVKKKWVIGRTAVQIKRSYNEQLTDTVQRRFLTIRYGGHKSPLRPRVILADMKMRPGSIFSQDSYEESLNNLTAKGIFSSIDINFTPRRLADGSFMEVSDTVKDASNGEARAGAGVLDMTVNATLDKPYNFVFEADVTGKSNRRIGPGVSIGLDKSNAFRGGELFSVNVGANYEFQWGSGKNTGNSYDFTLGTSLQLPRLLLPNWFNKTKNGRRRRWFTTPMTIVSLNGEMQRRSGFFDRNVLSAEYQYVFQPSATTIHKVSPLYMTYTNTFNMSDAFTNKAEESAISLMTLESDFIPRMRYVYTYSSPMTYRNPIYVEITATEAGNITNLATMAFAGKKWNDKGRKVMNAKFGQFIKLETSWRKTWTLANKSSVVAHFYGGVMSAFGNNEVLPFSENFYIGGANDMRGFAMRTIGPGNARFEERNEQYLYNIGDTKAIINLEYRPHLFGSLYGALFIDAGGIWYLNHKMRNMYREHGMGDSATKNCAIDIGCGIRYDLDFFVLRLDWGLAIHNPAWNAPSGFFNVGKLRDAQCLNFAIGYPF